MSPVELRNLETLPVELETVAQLSPFDGFAKMNSSTSSLTNRNSDNTDNHVVDNRFDHTYHAVIGNKPKGKSCKKTKSKQEYVDNLTTSLSRDAVYDLTSDMLCTENFDVAAFYDISTSYINKTPTASTEIITQQTNQDYESYIRETPSLVCECCDRFLF